MNTAIRISGAAVLALFFGIANASAADLQARLSGPAWNGQRIPAGQQCHRFGGHGATPRLTVNDIPAGTQALILAFSDRDYKPMDNGGHGVIGYLIPPGMPSAVTVPSIPGHTFDLPAGFFVVRPHANPKYDVAGAYMPPCSGGKGHMYYVTVEAVTLNANGRPANILGKTAIDIGRY